MSDTHQFKLPLLEAGQAQKHISVNEAFARLDALAQLRLQSLDVISPPTGINDGTCYVVATGAGGEWAGKDGQLAIFSNGGWEYLTPEIGWRAWIVDIGEERRFSGSSWDAENSGGFVPSGSFVVNQMPWGSSMSFDLGEFEHVVTAGNTNDVTSISIPDHSWITAISFRVTEEIIMTGATSWRLGTLSNSTQFGSSLLPSLNEFGFTATTKRFYFYKNTPNIRIQAGSGDFVSGKIRFGVHTMSFTPPNAV